MARTATRVWHSLRGWPAACAAAAVLACSGGGGEATASPPGPAGGVRPRPSFLLVTLDTWRWDYIGASGQGRVATPVMDGLAREGLYEPEAETPYPLTTPAHATLLTGLHPLRHRVLDCISYGLPAEVPTLAEAFRAQGYGTAAFVSSQTLSRAFGLHRGFDLYDDGGLGRSPDAYWQAASRDGASITAAALAHLSAQPPDRALFLWTHYFDLHVPYRPRAAYDARYPGNPYAAQAAFLDDQVGALLAALRRDTGRQWRILIVGDHGEGLGDHGERGHGLGLYRSTLHVPLILHPKPERPVRLAKPWRLEDLAPTVLEWFALPPLSGVDGASLFSEVPPGRLLASMTLQPSIQFGVTPFLAVRRGGLMYMRHGAEELYDLDLDPGQTKDLSRDPRRRTELEDLRSACSKTFPTATLQAISAPTLRSAPAELQGLQGLGYIGGFAPPFAELQRVSIQRVLEDDARFEAARSAYRKTRAPGPFLAAYRELLGKYPRAAVYFKHYGILLLEVGDFEEAFKAFDRAVRLNPKDVGSLINLGLLYLHRGQPAQAQVLYEAALEVDPSNPVAHKNLGLLFDRVLQQPERAIVHYQKYLEVGGDGEAAQIRSRLEALRASTPPRGTADPQALQAPR